MTANTRATVTAPIDPRVFQRLLSLALNLAETSSSPRDSLLALALLQSLNNGQRLEQENQRLRARLDSVERMVTDFDKKKIPQVERRAFEVSQYGLAHYLEELGADRKVLDNFFRHVAKRMLDGKQRAFARPLAQSLAEISSVVDGLLVAGTDVFSLISRHPQGLQWLYQHPKEDTQWWAQPFNEDDPRKLVDHVVAVCGDVTARKELLTLLNVRRVDCFANSVFIAAITEEGVSSDPS